MFGICLFFVIKISSHIKFHGIDIKFHVGLVFKVPEVFCHFYISQNLTKKTGNSVVFYFWQNRTFGFVIA